MKAVYFYALVAVAIIGMIGTVYLMGRSHGKEQQVTTQRKVDDKARARIKAVPPADSRSTTERLQAGTF